MSRGKPTFASKRLPRVLAALALALALAGCAAAPQKQTQTPAADQAPARMEASFAQTLDLHAIPYRPPETGKAILVNIPSFELIAFEDGRPVLRSRVIVGRNVAGDRTPTMDTRTSVVRFRPTWRPTPMMVRRGQHKDRVWPPGPNNPLGLLAIRLEPGLLIYLHATNRPSLFDEDDRALSGGCIRVERWDELAAWVLDWPLEAVHEAANGRRTFDAPTSGVPVHVRYFRRFPDAAGRLAAHGDPYGVARAAPVRPAAAPAPAG